MNIVPVAERPITLGDRGHAASSLFQETTAGFLRSIPATLRRRR